jgi:cytoskeletal protein RodZ
MKFAGLWSLAAVAALTLSWVAVSQVRDRVIQPATVIPTTVVAVASDVSDSTVVVVEPAVDDRSGPFSPSTTSPSEDSASNASSTNSTRPPSAGPASTPTTSTSQTPSTTVPPVTTTTAPLAQTTSTTAPSTNPASSSHSTPGGSVTITSSPGVVTFVSAIPQAGFTTELRDTGPERVRVRFVSATTIFEFEAKWDNGRLDIDTSEHTP